jgi:DNA-binding NtrC family response regulator
LAVDDSPDTLDALLQNLTSEGYEAVSAPGAADAVELLSREAFDILITDMKMPGMSGMELVKLARERYPEMEIMMITGYATIEGAVEAVKTGAEEYLAKPFTLEEIFSALDRLQEKQKRRRESRRPGPGRHGLIGGSEAMRRTFAAMEQAALHPGPVLILGESGTGRASVARALASLRGVADGTLISLDAKGVQAVLNLDLLRGNFKPPAVYLRAVDRAGSETLAAIAGLLAGHSFLPFHLFLSAGPDLPLLVEHRLFPRELSAALSAFTVMLPPLRERGEDVLALAEHFFAILSDRAQAPPPGMAEPFRRALFAYSWPGNVEELREAVTRAFLNRRGDVLGWVDLPHPIRPAKEDSTGRALAEVEADHILKVLASTGGHRGKAAEILKIDRKTLREKLKGIGAEGRIEEAGD